MIGYTVSVELERTSPYSSSAKHDVLKKPKESDAAWEQRTWREKCHVDADGNVKIPLMAFKFAIMSAAFYLGERVPGKGNKKWGGYFTSAVIIKNDVVLPLKKKDLTSISLWCHSKGKRKGDGSRVLRTFPMIDSWSGTLEIQILDDTITEEILRNVLDHAGLFIGIGRFRPENGGFNGRFRVTKIKRLEG